MKEKAKLTIAAFLLFSSLWSSNSQADSIIETPDWFIADYTIATGLAAPTTAMGGITGQFWGSGVTLSQNGNSWDGYWNGIHIVSLHLPTEIPWVIASNTVSIPPSPVHFTIDRMHDYNFLHFDQYLVDINFDPATLMGAAHVEGHHTPEPATLLLLGTGLAGLLRIRRHQKV